MNILITFVSYQYHSSMISAQSAKEKVDYAEEHGVEEAISHFRINAKTLKRYIRFLNGPHIDFGTPKILVFDIETAPMTVFVWGLYKQRINHENIITDWFKLSWSAKWLHEDDIMSNVLTSEEAKNNDDKRITKSLWKLLDECDIVIAHNAKSFDIRRVNSRFMLHGLKPPSPYNVIDTLKESQKIAAHASHRLDYLGQLVRRKGKMETDYGLWKRCYNGDPEALFYMEKYNKEDVLLLEEVYLFMRPWMKTHPNIALYMFANEPRCTKCGSKSLHEEGASPTATGLYRTYRCNDCGGFSKERKTMVPLKNNRVLLSGVTK